MAAVRTEGKIGGCDTVEAAILALPNAHTRAARPFAHFHLDEVVRARHAPNESGSASRQQCRNEDSGNEQAHRT